jgi:(S)-ureidoglycine aminohydrolase
MRSQNQLLFSRTRVKPRYALLPLEGIPFSKLPGWPAAQVRVLAAPALGAQFVEYVLDLPAGATGSHAADGQIETFFSVLSGSLTLTVDGKAQALREGGFALVPPASSFTATAAEPTSLLLLRKRFEPAPGVPVYKALYGNQAEVKGTPSEKVIPCRSLIV